jgi:hypothetical protein
MKRQRSGPIAIDICGGQAGTDWLTAAFKSGRCVGGGQTPMQFLNQLIQFLQQGIAAIFKFIQLIWSWSIGQITQVMNSPWQSWPLWKQVLLVLVLAAVVFALFKVAKELWEAGERVLAAFAALLGVFVKTLPQVVIAGLIALSGLWLINNFNPSSIRIPTAFSSQSN